MTVIFDGSRLRLLVDGVERDSTPATAPALTNERVHIGAWRNAVSGALCNFFAGRIDEVRFYKIGSVVAQ